MKTRVALVVGHRETSKGAYNAEMDIHEYYLNEALATHTMNVMKLDDTLDPYLIYRLNGYGKLPQDINETNPDLIISFHHNSTSNKSVQGTETLYYHKSTKSRALASEVQKRLVDVLGFRDRGIKGIDSEARGGYLLKYTKAPCILIEPYFISNNDGLVEGVSKQFDCAKAISEGVKSYIK